LRFIRESFLDKVKKIHTQVEKRYNTFKSVMNGNTLCDEENHRI
jgi:hypothetical protein